MLQPVGVYLNCGMGFAAASRDPYQPCIIRSLSPDAIFETIDYEKYRKMEKTVDQIRKRFGMDSIKGHAFAICRICRNRPYGWRRQPGKSGQLIIPRRKYYNIRG